jgi:ATP-dependent DNA helicase RecQ
MLTVLKQARPIRERRGSRYVPHPTLFSSPVEPLAATYEERRQRDHAKLEQMVIYAQTARCRTRVLLEALGESVEWPQCGTCDNCRGQSSRPEGIAEGAA